MKARISTELRDRYILTGDSYTGGGGFANGGYLFKYGREMDFNSRQSMAYYINLVKPIIDSQTKPVFAQAPQRLYNNELIDAFINDADNNGTPLTQIIESATINTNLIGNSFLIMDNFNSEDIPQSYGEVLGERKFPYIYTKECEDVYEWDVDIFGRLTSISFFYETRIINENEYDIYKSFTSEEIEYFYKDSEDGVARKVVVESFPNNLGVIPVIYYNKDIMPTPPSFYSMACLARAIYNTGSEMQDLQRSQSFSILLIPSNSPGDDSKDNIVISNNNALFFDSDANNIPSYISPDSAVMKSMQDTYKDQVELLVKQADILGSSSVANGGKADSGLALSYKFFGKQQKLLESSLIATTLEVGVIELFCIYMGIDVEYETQYLDSFSPTFTEVKEKVTSLEQVINMDISETVSAMLEAEVVKVVGSVQGWEDVQLDQALDSIVVERVV